MADFCKECGPNYNDLDGLCEEGYCVYAICESCGPGYFDHEGSKVT